MPKRTKRYSQMKAKELQAATKDLDEEFAAEKSRPLNQQERQRHARARRRGRPRVGAGADKIHVTIERDLLARTDAFAQEHDLTRSEVIARGLRAVLAAVGEA